jgi:hypothetical protein
LASVSPQATPDLEARFGRRVSELVAFVSDDQSIGDQEQRRGRDQRLLELLRFELEALESLLPQAPAA